MKPYVSCLVQASVPLDSRGSQSRNYRPRVYVVLYPGDEFSSSQQRLPEIDLARNRDPWLRQDERDLAPNREGICAWRTFEVLIDPRHAAFNDSSVAPMPSLQAFSFEPMLCESAERPPEGLEWRYELKLDGFRAIGGKSGHSAQLWSRNQKDFTRCFPDVVKGIAELPSDTVIDREIVALDVNGKPSFNLLQGFGGAASAIGPVRLRLAGVAGQGCATNGEPLRAAVFRFLR
jgi:hypothetical protein